MKTKIAHRIAPAISGLSRRARALASLVHIHALETDPGDRHIIAKSVGLTWRASSPAERLSAFRALDQFRESAPGARAA